MRAKRIAVATGIACLLLIFSYALDLSLERLGVRAASTLVDNLLISVAGGGLAYSWTSLLAERDQRARERLTVIVELNRNIRSSLANISLAALRPDEQRRLEDTMREVERIEWVLEEVVPATLTAEGRRALLEKAVE